MIAMSRVFSLSDDSDDDESDVDFRECASATKKSRPLRTEAAAQPFQVFGRVDLDKPFNPKALLLILFGWFCIWPIIGAALCTCVFFGFLPPTIFRFFGYQ